MTIDIKQLLKSKTIIGIAVMALSHLAGKLGLLLDDSAQNDIARMLIGFASDGGSIAGTILAVLGRIRAKGPLEGAQQK